MRLLLAATLAAMVAASPAAAQIYYAGESTPADATTHDQVIVSYPRDDHSGGNSSRGAAGNDVYIERGMFRAYDWDRPQPGKGGYFADDYHVPWPGDAGRLLRGSARVYRGRDGLYYCRRWEGTTQRLGTDTDALLGEALPPGGSAPSIGFPRRRARASAAVARGRHARCGRPHRRPARRSTADLARGL